MNLVSDARYTLTPCEDARLWDAFCNASAEGTPFMQTWFTDAISKNVARYFCNHDSTPLAAVLVHLDEQQNPARALFSAHHTLCYAKHLGLDGNVGNVSKRFTIMEAVISALTRIHRADLYLSLHPKVLDVRPLLWHNHDRTGDRVFDVAARYTAIRDLTGVGDVRDLLKSIRKSRHEDYKKSLKQKIAVSPGATEAEIVHLYKLTFERQGIEVQADTLVALQNIVRNLAPERGFVIAARAERGAAVAITLVLLGSEAAYSLVIASDPAYRNVGANTACIVAALLHAKGIGKRWFDFVGANSPRRGDYKLSFRAELRCYFEARLALVEPGAR